MTMELWECDNCGRRAINGVGVGWRNPGDGGRRHSCDRVAPGASFPASLVELDDVRSALLGCVYGLRAWASDEDGVHEAAWDHYVAACKALRLPAPKEDGGA